MGEPYYIEMLEALYGVTFGNIDKKCINTILRILKQVMTKKEYKFFFASYNKTSVELAKIHALEPEEMALILKKAQRKIKLDKTRKAILELECVK